MKRWLLAPAILVLTVGMVLAGCSKGRSSNDNKTQGRSSKPGNVAKYTPKTRTISMFAVPAFIGEMAGIPALKGFAPKDFKKGGLNDGNEVFSWQPQSINACVGDTIKLAIGNPGPDDHTFTLPDLSVNTPVPSFKETSVSIKASKPGIFEYLCEVQKHTKYMRGTLVVFNDANPVCGA